MLYVSQLKEFDMKINRYDELSSNVSHKQLWGAALTCNTGGQEIGQDNSPKWGFHYRDDQSPSSSS